MSIQDSTTEEWQILSVKLDDEFQNLENIIISAFRTMEEYEHLCKLVQKENQSLEVKL